MFIKWSVGHFLRMNAYKGLTVKPWVLQKWTVLNQMRNLIAYSSSLCFCFDVNVHLQTKADAQIYYLFKAWDTFIWKLRSVKICIRYGLSKFILTVVTFLEAL